MQIGTTTCPDCKRALPVSRRKQKEIKHVDGELVEMGAAESMTCRCGGTVRQVFRRGFRIKLQCDRCREASWETDPDVAAASVEQRRAEWAKLEKLRVRRGYAPGWSKFRYKALFGNWPSREVMG
jgi:hypothetical protein